MHYTIEGISEELALISSLVSLIIFLRQIVTWIWIGISLFDLRIVEKIAISPKNFSLILVWN